MALWHDRRGRFSPLRAATLALLIAPLLVLIYSAVTQDLGPRPRTEAIHQVGLWAYRFLLLSLFVTPMRGIARYAALIDVRRMIGVGSFLYILLHLAIYIADLMFDFAKVISEIVLRYYLTIGFTAWLGLLALGLTSNDYMVRRLGGLRWRRLHWYVYPVAVLGTIHYFLQSKLEVFEPTVMGGLLLWLLLYRLLHWLVPRQGEFSLWTIAASWVAASIVVFVAEAVAFRLAFGVPFLRMLAIEFTFGTGVRPGWYVLAVGAVVTAIGFWRMKPAGSHAHLASRGA